MMLVIQIAAGIFLAAFLVRYWRAVGKAALTLAGVLVLLLLAAWIWKEPGETWLILLATAAIVTSGALLWIGGRRLLTRKRTS